MEFILGGVLFALFIAAQALALVVMRPVSMPEARQSAFFRCSPAGGPGGGLSVRGRRLLQS